LPPREQVNATLTQVFAAGGFNDLENTVGQGTQKFAGSAGAYYEERRHRDRLPQGSDVTVERLLHVDSHIARAFVAGDSVAFTTRSGEQTGVLRAVEVNELDGIPQDLQTTRLTLEEV